MEDFLQLAEVPNSLNVSCGLSVKCWRIEVGVGYSGFVVTDASAQLPCSQCNKQNLLKVQTSLTISEKT